MLIGISGKIGSGKDTFAKYLIEKNPKYETKSFAYKLKFICAFLTGTTINEQLSQIGKNVYLEEWSMTIGEMQQKVGTEAMRDQLHKDAWVIALYADYKESSNWIVTDLRFPNEAQSIIDKGGILIRIEGDPANVRKNSERDLNHPSETSLDNWEAWDYKFTNESPISNIKNHVNIVTDRFLT